MTTALKQPAAVRNVTFGLDQNDLARRIGKSQHQYFRPEFTDLLRRKIHDCRYLAADQRFEFIVARDLCGAAAAADLRAEIDGELVGGLASFGERLDRGECRRG